MGLEAVISSEGRSGFGMSERAGSHKLVDACLFVRYVGYKKNVK